MFETFISDFIKKHPNAPLNKEGLPKKLCPYDLGYIRACPTNGKSCKSCWNTQMPKAEGK